jgi:CBS domain-containing protein
VQEAFFLMRENKCDFLPVVGDRGNVIGVVTDRDMCIALGTRNRKPSDVRVWDVLPRKLFTCMEGDDIHSALGSDPVFDVESRNPAPSLKQFESSLSIFQTDATAALSSSTF